MQLLDDFLQLFGLPGPFDEDIRGVAQQLLLPVEIWLTWTSNFLSGSALVRCPWIAARSALALNSAEWVLLFLLIAYLQSS
jgi:hypothetical protein